MAADNLPLRDEKFGYGKLPEPFAKVRILPKMYVKNQTVKTNMKLKTNQSLTCVCFHINANYNVNVLLYTKKFTHHFTTIK